MLAKRVGEAGPARVAGPILLHGSDAADCIFDRVIAGATTEIAADRLADLLWRRIGIGCQQRLRRDQVKFGAAPNGPAYQLKSPALFIVARDDASGDGPRLPGIRKQYEKAHEPKELVILEGSAHAQFLFQTDQADRVMREILRFLSAK